MLCPCSSCWSPCGFGLCGPSTGHGHDARCAHSKLSSHRLSSSYATTGGEGEEGSSDGILWSSNVRATNVCTHAQSSPCMRSLLCSGSGEVRDLVLSDQIFCWRSGQCNPLPCRIAQSTLNAYFFLDPQEFPYFFRVRRGLV